MVYELKPWPDGKRFQYKVLYNFCHLNDCADGSAPVGALVIDVSGNLYGVTEYGGLYNNTGTVFKLSRAPGKNWWSEQVILSFCHAHDLCPSGMNPESGLTYSGAWMGLPYDGTSPLYGTTYDGGRYFAGTAFRLQLENGVWHAKVLHAFCQQGGNSCPDGKSPNTRLLVDDSGNVFGTTSGGSEGYGTIFELSPESGTDKWTYQELYTFCSQTNCADGASPSSGLTLDSSGNLYGVTGSGGQYNGGTVYEYAAGQESVLHSFCSLHNCHDGYRPVGDLALDASGNLFGVTNGGGHYTLCSYTSTGCGTLFKLNGTNFITLYKFCDYKLGCPKGENPAWGVITDGLGDLYGLSGTSGTTDAYSVFEFSPKH